MKGKYYMLLCLFDSPQPYQFLLMSAVICMKHYVQKVIKVKEKKKKVSLIEIVYSRGGQELEI